MRFGLFLLATACTGEVASTLPSTTPSTGVPTFVPPANCTPNAAVFDANVAPLLESGCAQCHGAETRYGAPYSLVTYDDLMTGERYNAVLETLMDRSMPPENADALVHADRDALVVWASCGTLHPPVDDGLEASRSIYVADGAAPATSTPIEITANNESVGVNILDEYRSFDFRDLVSSDRFIRRMEPIIDESRVLHHITLKDDDTGVYYYAWAPGTGPMQFPEGGIRITPDTELEIEIHYNNGAGVPDVLDSSGIRLWLDEPVGTEWAIAAPQSWLIDVPPFGTDITQSTCMVDEPFTVLASMPHMHETGSAFSHTVRRADGSEETLISLTGWSFEAQYIYDIGVDLLPGDELTLRCEYQNDGSDRVVGGLGTSDEMCFDFMFVTPPEAGQQCAGPF